MIAPRGGSLRANKERARLMRRVICAAFVLTLAPSMLLAPRALAADLDMDTLRGPLTVGPAAFTRWSGFYAGGQFSYSTDNVDFSKATQPLVADSLRDSTLDAQDHVSSMTVLNSDSAGHSTGWGGFVGYNTQWQDLVVGVEANYTHAPLSNVATNTPITRAESASGINYTTTITGSGSLQITDFGSARARFGYVLGNFMPYGFAGFALGRGSYNLSSEVFGTGCDGSGNCSSFDFSNSTSKSSALLYGFDVGAGLDVAVTQNVFVRAEYEFMQFAPIANITATITSARVGAGFKF
jgi:outer membrane immunogenic protein